MTQTTLRPPRAYLPRFASLRTIAALLLREMSTTYGRSPGGYAWAVLEPALALGLMVLVFSIGFREPPLGRDFAIFFASGYLPFAMFSASSIRVAQALNFNRQLLSFPRVTFLDAVLARFLLCVMTQAMVAVLILGAILALFDTRTELDLPDLLAAFALAAGLGLGVGLLNCLLISRHQLWHTVWSVLTRPLVLLSGVVFLHDGVPQPWRGWLEWNPLVHVTGLARRGLYHGYEAQYASPAYVAGLAMICALFGLLFLSRWHRDLLER